MDKCKFRKMYLVTGASGHLGSVLVRRILEEGSSVRALVLPGEEKFVPPGAEVFSGDITDASSLARFFPEGANSDITLVHSASIVSIASREHPRLWEVNVNGAENVFRFAKERGVGRTVYVSTVHAIPERPHHEEISEPSVFTENADGVVGGYARSKAAATALALRFAQEGLNLSVVFPSGIIGPGDTQKRNLSVRSIRAMVSGRIPCAVRGGYDFVDVRDVADGILTVAERGISGEGYILSGRYATIAELFSIARRFADRIRLGKSGATENQVCDANGLGTAAAKRAFCIPYCVAKFMAPAAEFFVRLTGGEPVITPYSVYTLQTNARFSRAKAEALGYSPRSIEESIWDMLREEFGNFL